MILKINSKIEFNTSKPPLIISEISGNHCGSKKKFLDLIKKANDSGADLVKIQTYEAEDITFKKVGKYFRIKDGIWKNINLWKLYEKACTPLKWLNEIFSFAKKNDICLFSTPFSLRAVDILENLNVIYTK